MKRLTFFLQTYVLLVAFFVVQKPVFMLFHWEAGGVNSFFTIFQVMWHGLPMDLSVAGYFSILPMAALLVSVFLQGKWPGLFLRCYFALTSFFISLLFFADLELYSYWGFRIDATILTYLHKPAEVVASTSLLRMAVVLFFVLAWGFVQFLLLYRWVARPLTRERRSHRRLFESALIVLLGGVMFIAIRGGVTTSTMNFSKVYFSKNNFLNHAAVNPVYSLFYSIAKTEGRFDLQYRFMERGQAAELFGNMRPNGASSDEFPQVLTVARPNIVLVILESFGAQFVACLGGAKGVTPNLCALANEGILFSNLYASSFRTERGLVSLLSGFPAQPVSPIIKYPRKIQSLHSIPKSVSEAGYATSFLYGGDIDFAYMKSYLVAQKVTDITNDSHFALKHRMSKWGVPDAVTFETLMEQINREQSTPFCKMFLTLSSHEPFDVPVHKFSAPFLNAVHYTDSCLGKFIDELKQSPAWDNTLLVLVPDHGAPYPNYTFADPARFGIFMIWAGGAVKQPMVVETMGSQADLAATLLAQLQIDHSQFIFSNNLFAPTAGRYAFYNFPNGFGLMTPKGGVVFDCNTRSVMYQSGPAADSLLLQGKAYLQSLYDEIERL